MSTVVSTPDQEDGRVSNNAPNQPFTRSTIANRAIPAIEFRDVHLAFDETHHPQRPQLQK